MSRSERIQVVIGLSVFLVATAIMHIGPAVLMVNATSAFSPQTHPRDMVEIAAWMNSMAQTSSVVVHTLLWSHGIALTGLLYAFGTWAQWFIQSRNTSPPGHPAESLGRCP